MTYVILVLIGMLVGAMLSEDPRPSVRQLERQWRREEKQKEEAYERERKIWMARSPLQRAVDYQKMRDTWSASLGRKVTW